MRGYMRECERIDCEDVLIGAVLLTDFSDMPDPPSPTYTPPAATVTPDKWMTIGDRR